MVMLLQGFNNYVVLNLTRTWAPLSGASSWIESVNFDSVQKCSIPVAGESNSTQEQTFAILKNREGFFWLEYMRGAF